MDTAYIIRIAVGLVIAGALFVQARRLTGQPNRRRAFQLGAAALVCFVGFNAAIAVGSDFGVLQQAMALVGMALFIGAAASLALSLRSGERGGQRAAYDAEAAKFRAERERALAAKRGEGPGPTDTPGGGA